jgi:hypothetical protein
MGVEHHRPQPPAPIGGEQVDAPVGALRDEPLERQVERLVQEHAGAHVIGDREAGVEAGLEGVGAQDA